MTKLRSRLRVGANGYHDLRKVVFSLPLPAVRRSFAIYSLIFAWICANGAVWDAVQFFAWARMFAGYSHTLPIRAALRETFDPGKPCEICMAVARAKEAERKQAPRPLERSAVKFVLACETQEKIQIVPLPRAWPAVPDRTGAIRREPVPVPPPRRTVA
ncbi:MAG TPA: hypothetical protein VMC06_15545 [Opitutaceae bacterium]|nr:hypothetical protein [Opitutaceae bacterium]